MAGPPSIEVDRVTKQFRVVHQASTLKRAALELLLRPRRRTERIEALADVSFRVEPGETVGVVGRNGSGKSTILTLLAGIYRPTRGRIIVRGRIASLLSLGAGFHPEMTAEDNAILNAMIHGLSRREALARLPDIVAFAGLEAYLDTQIKHFSSGMVLRLGFSVVIHTDPDVLLIDEVLAVGDETFQRRCRERIVEFQRAGKTILFVSHDLETLAQVAPRTLWIDRGRLRLDAATPEVLAAYRDVAAEEEQVGAPATVTDR